MNNRARTRWKALLVVLVLALLGGVGASAFFMLSGDDDKAPSFRDTISFGAALMEAEYDPLPAKLKGSVEETDENGIVHGVTPDGIRYTVHGRGVDAMQSDKVTLVAAGDQIGTDNSMPLADAYAGGIGDGKYDFTPFYQEVEPFIQKYDLRYINQETVMAGADRGYSGYPVFNSPDACAESIANVGFNMVNFCSNHTYDMGMSGIERSHKIWDKYPQLMIGGSYLTQEERETVHLIERNGMTFAFLAYTYGDNHYGTAANFPNSYYVCGFDKGLMREDIERAHKVADAVIVSMHWGTEYVNEPNAQQFEYAQFLADLEVDLVLGTHAHIMQPTRYVTGKSGNKVPVVYGLSDFVSGWSLIDTIFSGLFTCDFVRVDGDVVVQNPKWYPTVEWSNGGDTYVRFLKDMSKSETNANVRISNAGDDYAYFRNKLDSVGMEIPVILE